MIIMFIIVTVRFAVATWKDSHSIHSRVSTFDSQSPTGEAGKARQAPRCPRHTLAHLARARFFQHPSALAWH